jgi:hypothetical protein
VNSIEVASYLRAKVTPLPDEIFGPRYRAAARLKDGSYLSCVVFQSRRRQVDLALRRFDQTRRDARDYQGVVEVFVAGASRLAECEIDTVETSPYAWPASLLAQIHGETAMGWTAFVAEMHDGTFASLGTSFSFEFFDLPDGYTAADVQRIHSGMVFSAELGLVPYAIELQSRLRVYRERSYFTCYLAGLDV